MAEFAPAIILAYPQLGENIGAAARAMKNFGLTDLRLIAPRDGWPNPKAFHMASGADDILHHARISEDFEQACGDLQRLYATTGRDRYMVKPILTPHAAAAEMRAMAPTRCGILFGPERTGLTNDLVSRAECVVEIPANPEHPSLNLAQSVVIASYEWFQSGLVREGNILDFGPSQPASHSEIEGFFGHLEEELAAHDFFKAADKRPGIMRNIRNLYLRAQLTDQDVRTLRGVLRCLTEDPSVYKKTKG